MRTERLRNSGMSVKTSVIIAILIFFIIMPGAASAQGMQGQTTRVSVDSVGTQVNGESYFPSISADGRYVEFYSSASNLVAGDTNGTGDCQL